MEKNAGLAIPGYEPVREPRVAVAIAQYDRLEHETEVCLRRMEIYSGGLGIPLTRIQVHGTYIQWSRNQLVRIARDLTGDQRPTHLLWVDDDMVFPPEILERLLVWGQPIVGGLYRKKMDPFTPNLVRREPDGTYDNKALWDDMLAARRNGGLFDKFDGLATGMLLTDMRVYDAIAQPWFWLEYEDAESDDFIGEDTYFCLKATAAGIPMKVDLGVDIGHIGKKVYWMEPWWDWLEQHAAGDEPQEQ